MDLLDPTTMPVFGVYVLVAVLFLLVPISRHQRLHVGHAMAILMIFTTYSRIFFFDYGFEVFGEGGFYIGHMNRAEIPGLSAIQHLGINPPAMFLLFHFGNHAFHNGKIIHQDQGFLRQVIQQAGRLRV